MALFTSVKTRLRQKRLVIWRVFGFNVAVVMYVRPCSNTAPKGFIST